MYWIDYSIYNMKNFTFDFQTLVNDRVRSYNLESISNLCDYPIGMFLFAIHTCCKSQNRVQWISWRVFLSVSDQHNDASRLWICDWFWNWFSDQKNASTTVKIASKISLGLFYFKCLHGTASSCGRSWTRRDGWCWSSQSSMAR